MDTSSTVFRAFPELTKSKRDRQARTSTASHFESRSKLLLFVSMVALSLLLALTLAL